MTANAVECRLDSAVTFYALVPGRELAAFDPSAPSGRYVRAARWGMRAKAYWYLDPALVNYATAVELRHAAPPLVITGDESVRRLSGSGYQVFLELDDHYQLLRLAALARPAARKGHAGPRDEESGGGPERAARPPKKGA